MKCENCGKNEVTFVYQSNINGKKTEKHLCSECAEKMGYTQRIAAHNRAMMRNFWSGSLLDDFFSPVSSLMGRSRWPAEDLFEDFFADMPALSAASNQQKEETQEHKQNDLVDTAEQKRFDRMRRINALRLEMQEAVGKEEFERAAELRDQIRTIEAENE